MWGSCPTAFAQAGATATINNSGTYAGNSPQNGRYIQPSGGYSVQVQGGATATVQGVDVQLEIDVGGVWQIQSAYAAGFTIANAGRPAGLWNGQGYTQLAANTQYRVTARLNYTVTLPGGQPQRGVTTNSIVVTTP
jgi:hypothetical protein